jgi:uracil-DNA glycosylase
VGRLAIDRFLGPVALDDVVGRAIPVTVNGFDSLAIALPHPSGASSWIHQEDHSTLLDRALQLLRGKLTEVGAL